MNTGLFFSRHIAFRPFLAGLQAAMSSNESFGDPHSAGSDSKAGITERQATLHRILMRPFALVYFASQ